MAILSNTFPAQGIITYIFSEILTLYLIGPLLRLEIGNGNFKSIMDFPKISSMVIIDICAEIEKKISLQMYFHR